MIVNGNRVDSNDYFDYVGNGNWKCSVCSSIVKTSRKSPHLKEVHYSLVGLAEREHNPKIRIGGVNRAAILKALNISMMIEEALQ